MAEEDTALSTEVIKDQTKILITAKDIKSFLCPNANDQEIALFLKVCQSECLNPFAREIYLVKYSKDHPASIIIAIDAFLKAAENCDEYNGHEAGIILKTTKGELELREGSFILDEESRQLIGGWAKVFRKDRDKPFYASVNIKEYMKHTRGGNTTHFWGDMPATMIRKVALSHALREAFPNRFAGTYTTAEVEIPEGQLPPAFLKNGKPDWSRFWAKQKERGVDRARAHTLLGVSSIKDEWIGVGKTLEEVDDEITRKLKGVEVVEEAEFVEEEEEPPLVDQLFPPKVSSKEVKATNDRLQTIRILLAQIKDRGKSDLSEFSPEFLSYLKERYGAGVIEELSQSDADSLISALEARKDKALKDPAA